MRHGKKINHLSRTAPHRKAMLSNMASSLILNKRITTTVAKAKALRKYVEPLLTKAKEDTTHSRRVVFSYLNNKDSVKTLFDEVAEKITDRPGGYTRILKTGNRLGDNADMCIIELVDYNELLLGESKTAKSKTRRSRRGGKKSEDATSETKAEAKATVKSEEATEAKEEKKEKKAAPKAEAKKEEAAEAKAEPKEEKAEEPKQTDDKEEKSDQ